MQPSGIIFFWRYYLHVVCVYAVSDTTKMVNNHAILDNPVAFFPLHPMSQLPFISNLNAAISITINGPSPFDARRMLCFLAHGFRSDLVPGFHA